MRIRQAHPEDLPALLTLQQLAFQSEAALYPEAVIPPLRQTLAELGAEFPAFLTLVAEQNGQIVGSVRGRVLGSNGEIGRLMVHPAVRRRGLGRRLLGEIERALGTTTLSLFTGERSLDNLNLYAALGYVQSGQHQAEPIGMIELTKPGAPFSPFPSEVPA
ncbi:GNAT family N-acetyltransferase [Deinococcus irradiatisoli]|uniref:GNAT family N-acetyltransferase n=1 Tax=Deinococcus irradiatisoli TaxID=2202254 RepID=A0A2Z3JDD4_9DEIO|nr:GNAT family N-acetyltransferase [Deinococcus irradiatisoli]AWN23177.1 GNAT family N-acetyltransferase [Deinococcus irradiatisoli]